MTPKIVPSTNCTLPTGAAVVPVTRPSFTVTVPVGTTPGAVTLNDTEYGCPANEGSGASSVMVTLEGTRVTALVQARTPRGAKPRGVRRCWSPGPRWNEGARFRLRRPGCFRGGA